MILILTNQVLLRKLKGEWNNYYRVIEEIDSKHLEPSNSSVETTIFVYTNWAGDTKNRRSTSGMWLAKKQEATKCSSSTVKFNAMRKAAELALSIRYKLRSIGIPIKGPTRIL